MSSKKKCGEGISSPETATVPEWERCIEGQGIFQLPYGKRHLCGAQEHYGCPYLHPVRVLMKFRGPEGVVTRDAHVCTFQEGNDEWKNTVQNVLSRWDWVFQKLVQEEIKYTFLISPKPAETIEDKRTLFPGYPLEQIVQTKYYEIEGKTYEFVFPSTRDLSTFLTRKVFRRAQGQKEIYRPSLVSFLQRRENAPPSMGATSSTPFPSREEMGVIDHIFVHEASDLETKDVVVPLGGKSIYERRISLLLPYSTVYDILAAEAGSEKVTKVSFW